MGYDHCVKEPLHPTALAVQQAERRHKASVDKEADLRAALEAARKERDDAIRADPEQNSALVGRRFGVSATWVKKIRKDAVR